MPVVRELAFDTGSPGPVSALLERPDDAWLLYVLAHGAGAGMRHPFLAAIAQGLGALGIATLRYQFPYVEARRRRPDPPGIAEATVRAAVGVAAREAGDLPVVAGGKSFGGRMTSQAAARAPLTGVVGLVFLGFPLHAPGKPSIGRAAHLDAVTVPMLFLQGTGDRLAQPDLLQRVCQRLGARATLRVVEGADHSFKVPKRSGHSGWGVVGELARAIADWGASLQGGADARRGDLLKQ